MRIEIEKSGRVIGYDKLFNTFLRYDLLPVPVSFEFSCKLDDDLKKEIKEGAKILVGDPQVSLTIVKLAYAKPQAHNDGKRIEACVCTAILSGTESLIDPLSKAVILYDTSFARGYKASGSKVKFGNDIPLPEFICAYGSLPTYEIAKRMQEESACIVYRDTKIQALRLQQLFKEKPILTLDDSSVSWVANQKVEQAQIPSFVTVNSEGTAIESVVKNKSTAHYYPKADTRRLKNLTSVLVTRGTITRAMSMNIHAGDLIQIESKKYVVLTALHHFASGALGGHPVHVSKLWLASWSN